MTDTLPPNVDTHSGSADAITRRDVVIGAGAVLGAAVLAGTPALAQQARVKLRLLETTDLHVNVLPYDYYRDARRHDRSGPHRHADRRGPGRGEERMLFDNGDLIQGNPMGDFVAYRRGMKEGDVHPMVAAMNTLDYDCAHARQPRVQLRPRLPRATRWAAPNFRSSAPTRSRRTATTLREAVAHPRPRSRRRGRRASSRSRSASSASCRRRSCSGTRRNLDGKVTARDIVDAAQKHVPDIKKAGADIVVALCHSGIDGRRAQGRRGERRAAPREGATGIDVIFTGHQHQAFPGGKEFANIPGVDVEEGNAARQARRHGRLLGQPSRRHRPRAGQGRRWLDGRAASAPRPARSTTRDDRKIVPEAWSRTRP